MGPKQRARYKRRLRYTPPPLRGCMLWAAPGGVTAARYTAPHLRGCMRRRILQVRPLDAARGDTLAKVVRSASQYAIANSLKTVSR